MSYLVQPNNGEYGVILHVLEHPGGECMLNTQKDIQSFFWAGQRVIGTYWITLEGPYIMLTCSRLAKLSVKPVI